MRYINLVAVGDFRAGKTSLMFRFIAAPYPTDYIPSIVGSSHSPITEVDGVEISVVLTDTLAGTEICDRLRPTCYPWASVLIACFSLVDRDSFRNIEDKWLPELREHCLGVPIILVGTKKDLRENEEMKMLLEVNGEEAITSEDGHKMAEKINAATYMECSANENEGCEEIFQLAARAGLEHSKSIERKKKKKNCCIS